MRTDHEELHDEVARSDIPGQGSRPGGQRGERATPHADRVQSLLLAMEVAVARLRTLMTVRAGDSKLAAGDSAADRPAPGTHDGEGTQAPEPDDGEGPDEPRSGRFHRT